MRSRLFGDHEGDLGNLGRGFDCLRSLLSRFEDRLRCCRRPLVTFDLPVAFFLLLLFLFFVLVFFLVVSDSILCLEFVV